jgi:putative membrane protein
MPWPWMLVFPLVGLVIMIVLVSLVFRRGGWMSRCMSGHGNMDAGPDGRESAMDVLKRRYASGEISREEFDQMRQDLQDNPPDSDGQRKV